MADQTLALFGGAPTVDTDPGDMFTWPIITPEDEAAALEVLRRGAMSDTDVTKQFEAEFSDWIGLRYCLGMNTGTAAIESAMFACGVGHGDEIIAPSLTYWASVLQVYSLQATVVFAEVDPGTLCLDPGDIEHRITERTKAIMVVHYCGHPADMDPIMDIARRHGLKVIEDVSHAQGTLYRGRKAGTIGDVGAMSLMSGKALAIGEAGILCTENREIHDRAVAWGHYSRFSADAVESADLKAIAGLPLGGNKYRMHQLSSAVGRVQLKYYEERIAGIQRGMNRFWDLLDGVKGVRAHRPAADSGSTMGGWYYPLGLYVPEEVGGLSVTRFCEAVRAEGADACSPGCNTPLHLHPVFSTADIYAQGRPTRTANSEREVRQDRGSLPVTESIGARVYSIPWFKHDRPDVIEQYALAFRKVSEHHQALLKDDPGDPATLGDWHLSHIG